MFDVESMVREEYMIVLALVGISRMGVWASNGGVAL